MKLLCASLVALGLALGAVGCPIHAAEPKQREDWSLPPSQYGDTRYEGLRAPRQAQPHWEADAAAP